MGLGSDVACWAEESGFRGSFMDAWEAYGNGDDVHSRDEIYTGSDSDDMPFAKYKGFISRGADLLVATMTLDEAFDTATELEQCKGFCFRGDADAGPVEVFFKSKWELIHRPMHWTAFRKESLPWEPYEGVFILKDDGIFRAGQVHIFADESLDEKSWLLKGGSRVQKFEHGQLWVAHDGLPLRVQILENKFGCTAGQILRVKGDSKGGASLLLENGGQLPVTSDGWKAVNESDLEVPGVSSLIADVARAGSVADWRDHMVRTLEFDDSQCPQYVTIWYLVRIL